MRKRSNLRLRLKRFIAVFCVLAILSSIGALFIELKLRRIAHSFAISHVSAVLSSAVGRAAERLLDDYGITYDEVAVLSRNNEGLVTSLEINSNAINRFKSSMIEAVRSELSQYEKVTFRLPVMAAFGIYYTYLSYPKVSYTVSVTTAVFTEFRSEFSEAGINQVLHRITVRVGTKGRLALLGEEHSTGVATDFTLAETVIVGAVPDAFTNIDYANEDIVDDVFDYGASVPE